MATAQETIAIYNAVLQRAPTDAELASFVANSQTAQNEQTQIDLLVNSSEANDFVAPIVRLYQATFGRVPDAQGLDFWTDFLRAQASDGMSTFDVLTTINAGFAQSSEFATLYPTAAEDGIVTEEFLNDLYQNTFQRDPTDADIEFYVGKTIASTLSAFAQSSETINDFGPYVNLFLNKAANGNQDYEQSLLDANDDGQVNQADVDAVGGGTTTPGGQITLTANADGPGATAPAVDTNGTAGNDVYNAVSDAAGGTTTLTTADIIDGKGGTDTLNVRVVDNAGGGTSVAPQISNVEVFNITNLDTTAANFYALNFGTITGEQQVWSVNSAAGSATRAVAVDAGTTAGLDGAQGTFGVNYKGDTDRTGTSDAFSLAVKGAGTAATAANFTLNNGTFAAIDNTFEVANVVASGAASNITINAGTGANGLRALNASGDVAANAAGYGLTIADAGSATSLATVDASGLTGTGGININAATSTSTAFSFKGSAVADRVVLNGGVLNATNTVSVDGGEGKDTLAVGTTTDFTGTGAATLRTTVNTKAAGIEVLEAAATDFRALKANDFTTINEFAFTANSTGIDGAAATNDGADALVITGIETADSFRFASTIVGGAGNTSGNGGDAVELTPASNGPADVANVVLTGASLTGGATGTGMAGYGLNAGQFETVNITSSGLTAAATNTLASGTPTGAGTAASGLLVNTNGVVNVTGANDLVLTVQSVNPTAGGVQFKAGDFTGKLNVTTTSGNDAIIGGKGNDIINSGAGQDSIDLSAGGQDIIRFGQTASADRDTITGFQAGAGGDVLDVAAATFALSGGTDEVPATDYQEYTGTANGYTLDATKDVFEFNFDAANNGANLANATNGSELLKAIANQGSTISGLTATASDTGHIVAYDNGNAYVYYFDAAANGANTDVEAADIQLIGTLNGIEVGALTHDNFA
ncbi:protein of unknown function [Fulvimarina manganoxydans]|uniref:DUF4214 domain-containing protein n=1 Tax=Fulvimarina manganoxydans TaxID=937218 RepID=A0A1W2EJM5_9HYPH|nr:DUF4214 domain-containing protein [Fulvimarina manganoxydans]SMD09907.1 protein of unknown function [Fulvimarina manganoxydans]